jgi:hypothetical protein
MRSIRMSKDTDVGLRFYRGLRGCITGDPFRCTACSPRGRNNTPTMERSKRQQEAEHTTESIINTFHSVLLSCVLRSGTYQPQANNNIRLYVSPAKGSCTPVRTSGRYTGTHQRPTCPVRLLVCVQEPEETKRHKALRLTCRTLLHARADVEVRHIRNPKRLNRGSPPLATTIPRTMGIKVA